MAWVFYLLILLAVKLLKTNTFDSIYQLTDEKAMILHKQTTGTEKIDDFHDIPMHEVNFWLYSFKDKRKNMKKPI